MKGRSLILIFLFLFCTVLPVQAGNGTIDFSGSDLISQAGTGGAANNFIAYYDYIVFRNPENLLGPGAVKYVIVSAPTANVYKTKTGTSYWEPVTLKVDGVTVGTGQYGYTSSTTTGNVYIGLFFNDDFDISGYTGQTKVTIDDNAFQFSFTSGGLHCYRPYTDQAANTAVFGHYVYLDTVYKGLGMFTGASDHKMYTAYSESYSYNYTFNESYYRYELNFSNPEGWQKKLKLNNGYIDIVNETSFSTATSDFIVSTDLDNSTWAMTVVNGHDDIYSESLEFVSSIVPTAAVNFNQSFYTDPDPVGVIYDIENFDNTNYEYWILVTGTNGGTKYIVSNDYYDITTATGQDDFTISYSPLTLPFTMQAELWMYSKVSGESSVQAYSSKVQYNRATMAPGTIWTEKSNYNISEIFYIEFDTNYNTCQIELISSTFHDLRTMEGPGVGHLGYMFNSPHNFTAYLIEAGVKVAQVKFTVSANEPFLNIWLDSVPTKQVFGFEYFTDNSSDVITGYKPDGSIFYGPVTNLVTNSKSDMMGLSSASPAGIYTISLLHEGTDYFNDTIEMYSTSEYVYFEGNKYETGDTIKIYSYVTDSRQQIRLSDSSGQAIITWTSANGYIIPNAPTVLYFSLTDNNEYGMNIETAIDSGSIRSGNWKVEIIDIDGRPLTDESTYDYTTVGIRIDDPADASNEFIKIIFSPEGLFMILTVCLTMMGLVTAKHPAGGGAGAVVGVGFGVYFGVLPVWMLLLMVIALVVLAGVSVAVYFKGK